MESKEILYKPKDLYERQLKAQYHQGAEEYFDKLAKEAGTDEKANAEHVSEYKNLLSKQKEAEGKLGSSKGLKTFFIVLIVFCFLGALIAGVLGALNIKTLWWLIIIAVVLAGVGIYLIVHITKSLNKVIKQREDALNKAKEETEAKLKECYADMASLNASFDWSLPGKIMERVTNIIDLDPYFSANRLNYLVNKFGFDGEGKENESILGILSGNIQGNPFILKKTLKEDYQDKTYTGSITITWTTYTTDSKGNRVAHHHSQTLTAKSVHKAPFYSRNTVLVYGNEAAPHLNFSRAPSSINTLDEKEREKTVKSKMKEINKLADKAITSGKTFTPTGNDEFDVFFGALDRDNEVEFRLLFTPLAQTNMMSLLSDPNPYGDDFYMVKEGMVNYVCSKHSQSFDYSAGPSTYTSYDFTISKNSFITYCDEFIKHLFFDLAPLLSIPLYQMHMPQEYIFEQDIASNYSYCEHEAMANSMDQSLFMPDKCDPSLPVMIKSISAKKDGELDRIKVHTYSYKTTPKTDYISMLGGDGRWHDVPVHWTQYDRIDGDGSFCLAYTGASRKDFNAKLKENKELSGLVDASKAAFFGRGMFSMMLDDETRSDINGIIKEAFEEKSDEVK